METRLRSDVMLRWIFATVLFFLVVIELVFFAPDAADRNLEIPAEPVTLGAEKDDSEQVLAGGYLVESQGEMKAWELWSKVARKKRAVEDWALDEVKVRFYGKRDVVYVATGDKGFVTENQKKLKIQGNVVVRSSNGYVLNTSVIHYQASERSLFGPEPVDLVSPKKVGEDGPLYLTGQALHADLNTNIIRLSKGVRGRKRMSQRRKMRIKSRDAIFSGQSNLARFEKNVEMTVDQRMTVKGPLAEFVYKNGELDTLSITGGVQLSDVGKSGAAGSADVFFREDKYVFQGEPKVLQGEDELIGSLITIFDGGERIQVVKARAKYKPEEQNEGKKP